VSLALLTFGALALATGLVLAVFRLLGIWS
jgi:hypothetical protein